MKYDFKKIKLTDAQASKIINNLKNYDIRDTMYEKLFEEFRKDFKRPKLIVLKGGKTS